MPFRRGILVRGIVQGVGFRPWVFHQARAFDLTGFVLNRTGEVWIEVQGKLADLDRFMTMLASHSPPLARIDAITTRPLEPITENDFRIEASSAAEPGPIFVAPDVAPCAACLAELCDSGARRFHYPFLNCTHCGPRLTIITGAPYDRARTTLATFPLCPACQAEYDNPADRRFHAQAIACPVCGPQLQLVDRHGKALLEPPLSTVVAALRRGQIVALKGLGGFHLACLADNDLVVRELRRRKQREEKPFAVMVANDIAAARLGEISLGERDLLNSPARPIVLLRRRTDAAIADAVAPHNPYLGVMLPYTPLHHLLFHDMPDTTLVMTSGNRADEPIAHDDADALERLGDIADLFLLHNRPIHVRCDDSVTRVVAGVELPLRRSRGYAPQPITLPFRCPQPILAVGGQFKGTFALGRDCHAFLSHHLGDLDDYAAFSAFRRDIALYEELFALEPTLIVHDLHPNYASTQYARERIGSSRHQQGFAVQHHHAHLAGCMAENNLTEPVIGVTFDGTGYGLDGTIWGGEFLVGDYRGFRRAAHFRPVPLPGGDRAVREPWRIALAYLRDAGVTCAKLESRIAKPAWRTIQQMLDRGFQCPLTSSAGRLFDAVAVLAGVRETVSFEGQAAMQLEWLATGSAADAVYPYDIATTAAATFVIDFRPLIRAVVGEPEAAQLARRFHATLAEVIGVVCARIREQTSLNDVVLTGGVFLNTLLTIETTRQLESRGFRVYRHRLVPPSDAGLSLGQLAIAAANVR